MTESMAGTAVLLIEDDLALASVLVDVLQAGGSRVQHAQNAAEAEALLAETQPDLILLDLMLPDEDGLVLCAELRERIEAPIIIISGTDRKWDRILGLKLGADAFIPKPFELDEFEARVEAVLRRTAPQGEAAPQPLPDVFRVGGLTIDHARRHVTVGGRALQLTPTEYHLLLALASRPNEVLSREELAQRVWGCHDPGLHKAIDVHMRRLRGKLSVGDAPPIVTVRGFGHKIVREPRGLAVAAA